MPYSYQSGAIERQWLQASHDTLVRSRNGFCFYAANEKLLKRDILPWLNFSQDAFLPHRQAVPRGARTFLGVDSAEDGDGSRHP